MDVRGFQTNKRRLPENNNLERYFHAALHLVCMLLGGGLSICLVTAKQPSNTVTQNKEFELGGLIANFGYFWGKVEPIHPLSDKVFEWLGS